ncbi:MAG TPA: hypothetical protein VF056_06255 [Thermoleophilaceae bacterium]
MAGRFEGSTVIDRPIEEVFAFLEDGENDPKGKLIAPMALRSARKGADDFATAIKRAVESS